MTYSAVQMKTARLELRIAPELLAAIDAARGDVSRTRWVERALESALRAADGMKAPESVLPHGGQSSSAPSRAPAEKVAIALEARDAVRARSAAKPAAPVRRSRAFALDPRQAALNKAKKT